MLRSVRSLFDSAGPPRDRGTGYTPLRMPRFRGGGFCRPAEVGRGEHDHEYMVPDMVPEPDGTD